MRVTTNDLEQVAGLTEAQKLSFMTMFDQEISQHSKLIDPDNELDWYSLTTGWALGKGLCPDTANSFARWIRYHTDLG